MWEIPIIVTLNLTFNFNPRKTDFSLKKCQNQKKTYKWKNLAENSLQNRCIKKYNTWSWDIDTHSLKKQNITPFEAPSWFVEQSVIFAYFSECEFFFQISNYIQLFGPNNLVQQCVVFLIFGFKNRKISFFHERTPLNINMIIFISV